VLSADAYLFKPSDTTYLTPGSDNGTPMQKDEPQAQNPPSGATIDYFLKSNASGPVTLEILDASGKNVRTFSSDPSAQQPVAGGRGGRGGGGGIPNVSPLWVAPPAPISAAAGLHRVSWTPVTGGGRFGGGGGRGGATVLTGTFTAKLTVNGQSYSQSFTVKPDPRIRGG